MRSSINIFSREEKCRDSRISPFLISSSCFSKSIVLSADFFRTLLTVRKCGLLSSIIQQLGEILTSQSVKAYRASIVLSDEVPGARCTNISTLAAVLSSTLRILIFPLSTAFRIESITVEVVFPYGISVIASVLLSILLILARTFTAPPRSPSLYLATSIEPPVWKSGYSWNSSPRK